MKASKLFLNSFDSSGPMPIIFLATISNTICIPSSNNHVGKTSSALCSKFNSWGVNDMCTSHETYICDGSFHLDARLGGPRRDALFQGDLQLLDEHFAEVFRAKEFGCRAADELVDGAGVCDEALFTEYGVCCLRVPNSKQLALLLEDEPV